MSKLPVLMYHNLCSNASLSKGLTLSVHKFEAQMKYLVSQNYNFIFSSELINCSLLPKKSIIITFDDVTVNQLQYAVPILEKYSIKATFFIPFNFVGKSDLWNLGPNYTSQPIMTLEQLKTLNPKLIELGHHSFSHQRLSGLLVDEIEKEFSNSFDYIKKSSLTVFGSIAYPYGDYPKNGEKKKQFIAILKSKSMKMGFRIGNRINKLPLKNLFEIQRLDIRGELSQFGFKLKIRFGKTILF